ncbi:hypothetical protein AB4059_06170 [Lysobacter sp. 2RAF19]
MARKTFRRLVVAALVGIASFGTNAIAQVAVTPGTYLVDADKKMAPGTSWWDGCMIVGSNGTSTIPSLYVWNPDAAGCGASGNAQALWSIYPVTSLSGKTAHVIRSQVNGMCLIRSANGQAPQASLHLWTDSPLKTFCGFLTADALITNGQGAWDFSAMVPVGPFGGLANYAGRPRISVGSRSWLVFSPDPTEWPSRHPDRSLATFTDDAALSDQWMIGLTQISNVLPN